MCPVRFVTYVSRPDRFFAGWGARIRSWEWRNQNPPNSPLRSMIILKKCANSTPFPINGLGHDSECPSERHDADGWPNLRAYASARPRSGACYSRSPYRSTAVFGLANRSIVRAMGDLLKLIWWRVWRCLHPAHPGHGHSRPTGLGAVALAERICGEADRLDPTGMSRSRRRRWRAPSSPRSRIVPNILQ